MPISKRVLDFLSQQSNVTFLIAVVSFILSTGHIVVSVLSGKESYKLEVVDYAYRDKNVIQFLVCIANRSNSPLSIISISAFETTRELFPKMIYGKPENWNFRHTVEFPICIPAHGCQYAYLEFCGDNFQAELLTPDSKVAFEIRSTRKQVRKIALLPKQSCYLHARM